MSLASVDVPFVQETCQTKVIANRIVVSIECVPWKKVLHFDAYCRAELRRTASWWTASCSSHCRVMTSSCARGRSRYVISSTRWSCLMCPSPSVRPATRYVTGSSFEVHWHKGCTRGEHASKPFIGNLQMYNKKLPKPGKGFGIYVSLGSTPLFIDHSSKTSWALTNQPDSEPLITPL